MSASELIDKLNQDLFLFKNKFTPQFHLKIPAGVVRKIDTYRVEYFSYIEDSSYKSNICYLLQCVDYQLWLYQLFRPSLSLENTYFYQLLVTMGIIAEGLVVSILLNPFFVHLKETSTKDVNDLHVMKEEIIRNSFQKNIQALDKLGFLPQNLVNQYQDIRLEIRNIVHIQNWDGRLHESLTLYEFEAKMSHFKNFLLAVKENINLECGVAKMKLYFFKNDIDFSKKYRGVITNFNSKKGYGFIVAKGLNRDIYYHISNVNIDESHLKKGVKINFRIKVGKSGLEAREISLE